MTEQPSSSFESLLERYHEPIERFIHYKMPCTADAEDVIQNTYLAAFRNFDSLRDPAAFKYWLLSIAKNECRLYYRKKYRAEIVSIDRIGEIPVHPNADGDGISRKILEQLPSDAREIMALYYLQGKSQAQIAKQLDIPVGTVKSRLYYARAQFKSACPPHIRKMYERGSVMKENTNYTAGFPMNLPEITITKKDTPFFEVKYAGYFGYAFPEIGKHSYEGLYRYPKKTLTLVSHYRTERKCTIHEVEGVKVCEDIYSTKRDELTRNAQTMFLQITDEYIRSLGFMFGDAYTSNDSSEDELCLTTFLDDDFNKITNAEDPIRGNRRLIEERPATFNGDEILVEKYHFAYTTGVYDVTIGGKTQETICILRLHGGHSSELYINRKGHAVLMRWYETWHSIETNDNYPEEYMATLGDNRRVKINGTEFIHLEDRLYKTEI